MSINISLTESEIFELVDLLGINNHTVRKILFKLKSEGLEKLNNRFSKIK